MDALHSAVSVLVYRNSTVWDRMTGVEAAS